MFSDWSDQGQMFSSSGEWCLSEHLSVVSEGMGFSETICSVSNVQCLVWSGQLFFFFMVNGVYQSIYQLFRREWASQKRSVVCLMFSDWSDQGRCFSSSGEWCLSEHLSVVSEGMGFSETICSVSNVQWLVWSGAEFFFFMVNGVYQSTISCFGGNGLLRNDL